MGRSPCCEKVGLKKGPWTPEEDQKLLAYIEEHGHGSWRALPSKAGLQRCGKSCRLRWTNYLRPDIKRGKFTLQEEQTIIQLHALLGNRWSAIATHLPKRTDNEIKNYWNTHLKKRLAKLGIDPVTHKPRSETSGLLTSNSDGHYSTKRIANLSHIAQWESARLEAEARLVRESKLRAPSTLPIMHSPPPPQHQHNKSAAMTTCLLDSHVTNMVTQRGEPCRSKSTSGCSLRLGGGGGRHVDLQSPTSTLSFSDTRMVRPIIRMGFAHQNSTALLCHDQAHLGDNEGLEVEQSLEFKCFDKPLIRMVSDNKDHRHRTMGGADTGGLGPPQVAAGLPSMDTSNTACGAEPSSWVSPESTSNCSTMRFSTGGDFGPPPPLPDASGGGLYTEMLLNSSHNVAGADDEEDSDLVDVDHGGSCGEEEDDDEDEDEGNNYWNNILDLVKLSPPSNSPPSPVF